MLERLRRVSLSIALPRIWLVGFYNAVRVQLDVPRCGPHSPLLE